MKRLGLILTVGLMASSQAFAAETRDVPVAVTTVSAEEFASLKQDFASLAQRFEQLAAENQELRKNQDVTVRGLETVTQQQSSTSWAEDIAIKGDFRYRYQNDDVGVAGVGDRNRQRIRARPAIVAKLPGNTEIGFGLATGSDDPVSSNQTLGEGGSSKGVNIDLAYFKWMALDGLYLTGGKFKNEFSRTGDNGLLFDSDWRPEGIQALYKKGIFFANALGTWLESDGSSGSGEKFAWGSQAGVDFPVGNLNIKAGVSYYDIPAEGQECYFDPADCFGNSVDVNGNYLYDFEEINAFAEVGFELLGLPSQLFVDYVTNDAADDNDTGYAAGVRLGDAKKKGNWEVGYLYQDLEADAVFGLLTDSDFAGGGTDSKGHKLAAAYSLTDASNVQLTYFMTERLDTNGVENGGEKYDVDTLQLDFNWKYK